jgi:hypothetical protein
VPNLTPKDHLQALRFAAAGLGYKEIGRLLGLGKEDARGLVLEGYQDLLSRSPQQAQDAGLGWVVYGIGRRLQAEKVLPEARVNSTSHRASWQAEAKKTRARLGQIKINDLARECEIKSAEILKLLPQLGITEKKTHSSSIDDGIANAVRSRLGRPPKEDDLSDQADHPHPVDDDFLALALLEGRLRVVAVTPDGEFQFLDSASRVFDLLYTYTSETKALNLAIQELEDLLNSPSSKESNFQKFFERNPDFVKTDEHIAVRSDIYLARDNQPTLKPDFFLRPIDPAKSWDLLELKLPTAPLYITKANRERLSQAVMEARAQLLTYQAYFDEADRRRVVETRYGVFAYRPRMFVIIGRRGNVSPIVASRADIVSDDIRLRTYDDVLLRMRCKLGQLQQGHVR